MNYALKILRLGVPILVGQIGMIVTGFADTAMVGRYSTDALASASFVNNLFNAAMFAIVGFSYGITPLVGALFSQGRKHSSGTMMRTAIWANMAFCLAVCAVMLGVYFNLHHLGQPPHLLPIVRPYFLLFLVGMLPVSAFNAFAQWAYAIGRTKMPMWIILGANVLNILLNYLLIYGHGGMPELGLTGAGIATLIARFTTAIVIIAVFAFKREYHPYRVGFAIKRSGHAGKVWRTSVPVALQMAFESGAFTFGAIVAGWTGAIGLAAYQIIVIIGTLGFCVYYSMAAAVSVLVANAAGLSDTRAMRRIAFSGYKIMLILAAAASITFVLGGRHLMTIFTADPAVLALSVSLIAPLVLYQLGDATQITFANALRGTSHVMPMLWISFVAYVVIGAPATVLLAINAHLGVQGIIYSFSVSLFTAAALFLYFFLRATPLHQKN